MCTGSMPCASEDTIDPGLDGRTSGGGVGEFCPGRKGWKKAAEGGIPEACGEVAVVAPGRGVNSGSGGGGENSSLELSGFWWRERDEMMDPERACGVELDVLPLCERA